MAMPLLFATSHMLHIWHAEIKDPKTTFRDEISDARRTTSGQMDSKMHSILFHKTQHTPVPIIQASCKKHTKTLALNRSLSGMQSIHRNRRKTSPWK